MSLKAIFYAYLIGGVTFVPLLVISLIAFIWFTSPKASEVSNIDSENETDNIKRDGDDKVVLKTGTDDLAEKFHRKHEADVAAGYFAVCREYIPGGVNGKTPEIKTQAGEVVPNESPSIYQSMYKSIFDRVQKPTIEPHKENGKVVKRSNNVFYMVLRHGHLMLYDDIQQLEVRYVISLEHHSVDIYGGGDQIPEAELWIKRNAIRLSRKKPMPGDLNASLPFFLFSENCSEKEDFYFALLTNMQKSPGENVPVAQEFNTNHMITLVQGLHSSEEQLQTRWLNGLLGRIFLSLYKTPELEAHIRQKLTKKIARVKKPDFITKLALQKIDTGNAGPFITNPRLKDLTVNGDCTVEADVAYSGSFRIEIAATVRIDLGKRIGAREVDLVLAATLKKLQGHILLRLKPPPSNRLWLTFEKVPKVEMKLEPIVSTRQITYGVILRAMESRILEVITETLVHPFWDDIPFTHTEHEAFRGGIWKQATKQQESTEIADETAEDEAEAGKSSASSSLMTKDERVLSMPVLPDASASRATPKRSSTSLKDNSVDVDNGTKTPERLVHNVPPRMMRSTSFASAAGPMVSPSHAPAEASSSIDIEATSKRDSMFKDISRSLGTSPDDEPNTGPRDLKAMSERDTERPRTDSIASERSTGSSQVPRRGTGETDSISAFDADSKRSSFHSAAAAAKNFANQDPQKTLASIAAAKQAAQNWSWGVLARKSQNQGEIKPPQEQERQIDTSQPMGRGQPLPPPGQPLPGPPKPSMFSLAKKRPVPPPPVPARKLDSPDTATPQESPPKSAPPLPDRKRRQSYMTNSEDQSEDLLVVEAPKESGPSTPLSHDEHHDEFFGHSEESLDRSASESHSTSSAPKYAPPLPRRTA